MSEYKNHGKPEILLNVEEAEDYIAQYRVENFLGFYILGKKGYEFPIMVWNRNKCKGIVSHNPLKTLSPSSRRILQLAKYKNRSNK
jgi:hypothetical protein